MKRTWLALLLLGGTHLLAAQSWTPADFRGLKLGSAKLEDVKKVLGTPESKSFKNGSDILSYPGKGDNQGNLELEFRDGVLVKMTENLPVAMPRAVAFRKYGKDYVERRYSAVKMCVGRSGDDLLYRDSRGQLELIEYPQKGMLLWMDQFGYDVASIVYRTKPLATKKPICRLPKQQ
jgi:hypothetical protein